MTAILLSLVASACWGTADFAGRLVSKRAAGRRRAADRRGRRPGDRARARRCSPARTLPSGHAILLSLLAGICGRLGARAVLRRALDRDDEHRRADLGQRRGAAGHRRPARRRRAVGARRDGPRGDDARRVLASLEADAEEEREHTRALAAQRAAGARRRARLRRLLRDLRLGGRREHPLAARVRAARSACPCSALLVLVGRLALPRAARPPRWSPAPACSTSRRRASTRSRRRSAR